MSSQWFYHRDGKNIGPISSQQLRKAANNGGLYPTDIIWKEGLKTWVLASKINGLFHDKTNENLVAQNPDALPPLPALDSIKSFEVGSNSNIKIMTYLIEIAMADGNLNSSEMKVIKALQAKLEISNDEMKNIMGSFKAGIVNHNINISMQDSVNIFYLLAMLSVSTGSEQRELLDTLIYYGNKLKQDKNLLVQLAKSIELGNNDECVDLDNDYDNSAQSSINKFFKEKFPEYYQDAVRFYKDINYQITNSRLFLHNILAVARADSYLDGSEVKLIKSFCKKAGIGQNEYDKILRESINNPGNVILNGSPDEQWGTLLTLIKVAMADGQMSKDEIDIIVKYCRLLGISDMQITEIESLLFENPNDISRLSSFLNSVRNSSQQPEQPGRLEGGDFETDEHNQTIAGLPLIFWYTIISVIFVLFLIVVVQKVKISSAIIGIKKIDNLVSQAEDYMDKEQIYESLKIYTKIDKLLEARKIKKYATSKIATVRAKKEIALEQWEKLGYEEISNTWEEVQQYLKEDNYLAAERTHEKLKLQIQNKHNVKDSYIKNIVDKAGTDSFVSDIKETRAQVAHENWINPDPMPMFVMLAIGALSMLFYVIAWLFTKYQRLLLVALMLINITILVLVTMPLSERLLAFFFGPEEPFDIVENYIIFSWIPFVFSLLAFITACSAFKTVCPECQILFAKILDSSQVVGQYHQNILTTETDKVYNNQREVIGTVERDAVHQFMVQVISDSWHCKHCGHTRIQLPSAIKLNPVLLSC
ncbi:Dna-J like membrane chaperone protein [Limihaloglobus sulfuriphilus]|uniref:Dna-J like membrane chaperone protein n=1 Tax=Limihaloglobus sulfuriphilus TaxID=1851148 RepID=A0A1Q2MGH3_9BACT|nr:GYF domain-containing protein [Limihaloglobus sulfuriphilus]AQQ71372.1 Dna-J like membrane chaperone protein [Limihaloglobus sulfuriphilus]